MKKNNLLLSLAMTGMLLYGCDKANQDIKPDLSSQTSSISSTSTHISGADVINFEGLAAGTIISEVYSANGLGPVQVMGTNPLHPGRNAAMIFNSSAPTGNDPDLGSPNIDFGGPGIGDGGKSGSAYANQETLGKVLIITEDFNSSNPDDANLVGAKIELDFSALGSVNVYSMHILDIDLNEQPATVKFYGIDGNQIGSTYSSPRTGDNGLALLQFGDGVSNVTRMLITLNGSGAIDNITFTPVHVEEPPVQGTGCTYTPGYWKTHSKYGPTKKRNSIWDEIKPNAEDTPFFLSGQTYYAVLATATKGNAYYILSQQYVAAKLNTLNSASVPGEVQSAMSGAVSLFERYTPAQVAAMKGSNPVRQQFIDYAATLDKYNNGIIGPGHCD